MYLNVYEILDQYNAAPNKAAKIDVLRNTNTWVLRNVLKGTYDPTIIFDVEIPEYKPSDSPPGMGYSTLHQELSRIYLFQKDNPRVPKSLHPDRKKIILTQILEVLEAREAEVLIKMLKKEQLTKGLTVNFIKEALPDLL